MAFSNLRQGPVYCITDPTSLSALQMQLAFSFMALKSVVINSYAYWSGSDFPIRWEDPWGQEPQPFAHNYINIFSP